jgi:hypothetical protein
MSNSTRGNPYEPTTPIEIQPTIRHLGRSLVLMCVCFVLANIVDIDLFSSKWDSTLNAVFLLIFVIIWFGIAVRLRWWNLVVIAACWVLLKLIAFSQ